MKQKRNESSLAKGFDTISEKKNEEGNISGTGSDKQSRDEGDVDDSSTDSDSEDSKMAIVLMKKICNDMLLMDDICFRELFGKNNRPTVK